MVAGFGEKPYVSSIRSIILLGMGTNALEKFTKNSAASNIFERNHLMIHMIVRICDTVSQLHQNHFDFSKEFYQILVRYDWEAERNILS